MKALSFNLSQKVAAASMLLFLIGIWPLAYFTTKKVESNLVVLLERENASTVNFVAADIEQNVQLRIRALQNLAARLPVEKINDRGAMRGFLAESSISQELFSAGLIIIGRNGLGVADYPHVNGRDTADYRKRSFFEAILSSGKPAIGTPHIGRSSNIPLFSIGVPIKTGNGEVLGVLTGAVSLNDAGVFDLPYAKLGRTGELMVISVKDKIVITDTDYSLLLKPLPTPGKDKLLDRYLSGFDGSGHTHGLHDMDALSSAKHILDGQWIVLGELPQQEAYVPIETLIKEIFTGTLTLSVVITVLLWLLVRFQLKRVTEVTLHIKKMVQEGTPLKLLPKSDTNDEVGNLLESFNTLQTEIIQAHEEIRSLAFIDTLTGLPNRRLLLERLSPALSASARNGLYGALLFIDMDRFKVVNDTMGHEYGDMLLIEVGRRLKHCVREVDTVARLAGDEFVVLIENVSANEKDAAQNVTMVAEKIRAALAAPYQLKEHTHHSSPSIGVALFFGNNESSDEVIRRADEAMYQAKNSGRNAVKLTGTQMQL